MRKIFSFIIVAVAGLMICSSSSAFADVSSENCSGKPELNRCLHCGELHSAKTFKAEAKSVSDHVPPLETPLGKIVLGVMIAFILVIAIILGADIGYCAVSKSKAPDVK